MATVSFGNWRYRAGNGGWYDEIANNTSNYNGAGLPAGSDLWTVIKITTNAVTNGNKLGTLTVKVGISKLGTSPVTPTVYLSKTAYGSTPPTGSAIISTFKPSSAITVPTDLGETGFVPATLTCTFDCSSLSAASAQTLYLWFNGEEAYYIAPNGRGLNWTASLTHTLVTRTITYNKNGGSGTMSSVSVTYGGSHTVKENAFTPPAATSVTYTITLNPNYTNGTSSSKTVTNSTPKVFSTWRQGSTTGTARAPGDIITNITSNITLYAIWTNGTTNKGTVVLGAISRAAETVTGFKVTFNTQGGSSVSSITSTRKKSYTHDGWMTAADGTTISYNKTSAYSFTKDTDLYAKWSYTYTNNSITLPAAPTRIGYKFLGWGTSSNATSYKQPGEKITPSAAITYYAIWEPFGVVRIYISGEGYKLAVPYIYANSKWNQTIPYLYANDKWNLCS